MLIKLISRAALLIICFLALLPGSVCAQAQPQVVGGIGAMLSIDSTEGFTLPFIKSIVPLSPAALFLGPNLFILKVDDADCKNKTIDEIVSHIRGVIGSNVRVTVAEKKSGENSREVTLIRASIQVPNTAPPADPVAAFNASCEKEAKLTRRQGHKIVKTYNSECGNYFFNFNSDTGSYHVKVLIDYEKNAGFEATATLFDNNNESSVIALTKTGTREETGNTVSVLEGTVSFKKESVGVISIKMPETGDKKKCKALYVIVFK